MSRLWIDVGAFALFPAFCAVAMGLAIVAAAIFAFHALE